MPAAPRQPSNGPAIAAVLFVGAAILDFVSGARALTADGYLPEFGVDLTGMLQVCGALCILFGLFALVAAALSYLRTGLTLAIVAGALGMVGGGPFGLGALFALVGLVFVIRNRDVFTS